MAEKSEEKAEAAKGPGLAEKLPKILMGVFLLLNFGTMGGGIFAIYQMKLGFHKPAITEETEIPNHEKEKEMAEENPVIYSFEPFTVNLDGRPRKVVQATIQIELLDEQGYEETVNLNPVARDQITRILNSKKLVDIETIQGKLFLKDQILTAMNKILKKASVKEVYFSDFVVQ